MKNKLVIFLSVIFISLLGVMFFKFDVQKPLLFEFMTLNAEKLSLQTWRGKPVLVTFWATDCQSCLKEIPTLVSLYENYHSHGLEMLAISMYYEPPNHLVEFNKNTPLPYSLTLDIDANIAKAFGGVKVTPTTFLLNAKGNIIWQKVGLFEFSELQSLVEKTLKEKN